ncbi:polymorphic toxin-type HINT domain-containing protein [Streptomyces sp. NPDC057555]|uniref:polymorphic toxin-type HINT domain-containing protein n=1 Tax=Streptomyces sp. NPDC057555 TaxID=3346166 RepID=UPI003674E2F9
MAHIAATTEKPAQQQAALAAMDKPIDQVREFLRTRAYPGKEDDDRVAVAQIMSAGGPGVKAAANKALDGNAAELQNFLEVGQFKAREDDDRIAVTQAMTKGGPEVKAAAQAVLSGPTSGLRPFLQIGLYRAQQRDANAAAHIAEIDILLAAADKSAAIAQKDAAEAQRVAASARKKAEEAVKWAAAAKESADQASKAAERANNSANQAAESANQAAESAKKAQNAAAAARKGARAAEISAQQAEHSATRAVVYSSEASFSAYQAGLSAEAAGKDAAQAAKATTEARKTAAEKLVAELKAQVDKEIRESNKEVSEKERRAALEKLLVKTRFQLMAKGELKPGETFLACGTYGAGGMECIEHTYLDRLIAWWVGADEIERCLNAPSMSCLPDLAMNALKMKALNKLAKPCRENSFLPGVGVLMADHRAKPIEAIHVGDTVIATDPESGGTKAEPVRAAIIGNGKKGLVSITVMASDARTKGTLVATDQHPFWVAGGINEWLDAAKLKSGMRLRTAAGVYVQVTATRERATPRQRVRNLTVADLHTYYVLAGTTPILVHNDEDDPKVFTNRISEDKPEWFKPIAPGTVLTRSGNYAYVVLENGELVIGKRTAGHVNVARGRPVLAAGEFKTKGGEVVYLDNESGHYRPYGANAQQAATDAFNKNGLYADGKYRATWGKPDC